MSTGKQKAKKPNVLSGHKKEGKKFIPPMMQFGGFSEARWVHRMIPEFIWMGLLQQSRGYAEGAELARRTAEIARGIEGVALPWFAGISAFSHIPNSRRSEFAAELVSADIAEDLRHGLAPLQRFYPSHPLAFALAGRDAQVSIDDYKDFLADLYDHTSTPAMRVQATALYLAFDAGILKVAPGTTLADFPEVQHYPNTERSQQVASAVRAGLNAITVQLPDSEWPHQFWNRGLELEPCELREAASD